MSALSILARIVQGQTIRHFDTVRMSKDGRRIDVSLSVSPIKDSNGEIVGVSKIARDITDRKRAEAAFSRRISGRMIFLRSWATNCEIHWPVS